MASKPQEQSAVCSGQCAGKAPVIHTASWFRADKLWLKCLLFLYSSDVIRSWVVHQPLRHWEILCRVWLKPNELRDGAAEN